MRRTINAQTLKQYLSSAQISIMLCRAHADNFALTLDDILDAEWQIDFHIAELEALREQIRCRAIANSVLAAVAESLGEVSSLAEDTVPAMRRLCE